MNSSWKVNIMRLSHGIVCDSKTISEKLKGAFGKSRSKRGKMLDEALEILNEIKNSISYNGGMCVNLLNELNSKEIIYDTLINLIDNYSTLSTQKFIKGFSSVRSAKNTYVNTYTYLYRTASVARLALNFQHLGVSKGSTAVKYIISKMEHNYGNLFAKLITYAKGLSSSYKPDALKILAYHFYALSECAREISGWDNLASAQLISVYANEADAFDKNLPKNILKDFLNIYVKMFGKKPYYYQ